MNKAAIILGIFSLICVGLCEEKAEDKPKGPVIRARLEVKGFIHDDLPYYHDARIKYIPGADPVMHLYDEEGKEVKKVDVAEMSKEDIKTLLESHGLKRNDAKMKEEDQEEPEDEEPLPPYDGSQEEFPEEEDEEEDVEEPSELPEGDEATPKEKEEL